MKPHGGGSGASHGDTRALKSIETVVVMTMIIIVVIMTVVVIMVVVMMMVIVSMTVVTVMRMGNLIVPLA
jgi:hypothetical protein